VSLYERVTLELRKALAVFVRLGLPHPNHGIGAGVPKVIDDFGLLPKVVVQRSPLRSD